MAVFIAKEWFRMQIKPYLAIIKASGGGLVNNTVVNFASPSNSNVFVITDTAVLVTSKIAAEMVMRADTFDNCGDDMDELYVRCEPLAGSVKILVGHIDEKQKLFGTFSINYSIN